MQTPGQNRSPALQALSAANLRRQTKLSVVTSFRQYCLFRCQAIFHRSENRPEFTMFVKSGGDCWYGACSYTRRE